MSEIDRSTVVGRARSLGDPGQPFRLIDANPIVAKILSKRESTIIPKRIYNWGVEWIAEVGAIIRSRNFIASNLAYGIIGASKAIAFGQQERRK